MTTPAPASSAVPDPVADGDDLPDDVEALIDVGQYPEAGEFPVEMGYVYTSCSSVENGNPLFWDPAVAEELTGGPIAPPTMISVWFRPHLWAPWREGEGLALQVHFDMKARFDLPEAVMSDNSITFYEPVRPGDLLTTEQYLRSVSPPKTTRVGTGRFWVIEVEYRNQHGVLVGIESYTGFGYRKEGGGDASPAAPSTATAERATVEVPPAPPRPDPAHRLLFTDVHEGDEIPPLPYPVTATTVVLGALAARDWRPMHHDYDFAVNRNGLRDIFLNTPNQAAWFERYLTDWTGATGRLGKVTFRMKGSVYPGDTMVLTGHVTGTSTDATGCGWADVAVALSVDGREMTTCTARIALPTGPDDNPWRRDGDQWIPDPDRAPAGA